jgi:hypothetical protein
MAYSERVPEDGWESQTGPRDPQPPAEAHEGRGQDEALPDTVDMEPGRDAASALLRYQGETLLKVMVRREFHPIQDATMVPIYRCPYCGDGGLRTAGTIHMRKGYAFVRACDTCLAVEIGERHIG